MWENRNLTANQVLLRKGVIAFIILVLLFISFLIVFKCQTSSKALKNKYPKVSCHDTELLYQGQQRSWMKASIKEFMINSELEEKGETV